MTRDPRHRQLRQLRLHAQRLPAAARRRDRGRAQRRLSPRPTCAARIARVRRGAACRPGRASPRTPASRSPSCTRPSRPAQPLLGVCLGHQAIAEAFGATVTNAEELMHGKTSLRHARRQRRSTTGVPQPFTATRYHSLAVVDGTVPDDLVVTSRTQGGVIMGLRHVTRARSSACSSTRSRCSPRAATGCSATGSRGRGSARRPEDMSSRLVSAGRAWAAPAAGGRAAPRVTAPAADGINRADGKRACTDPVGRPRIQPRGAGAGSGAAAPGARAVGRARRWSAGRRRPEAPDCWLTGEPSAGRRRVAARGDHELGSLEQLLRVGQGLPEHVGQGRPCRSRGRA